MHALAPLVRMETKLFLREPMSVIFGLLFPAALLLAVGFGFPGFRDAVPELGGLRPVDTYAPIMLVFALTMLGITVLPAGLTVYRERGVLRRLRTTPVHPGAVLVAQLVVYLGIAVVASGLAITAAVAAFGIHLPERLGWFVLAFLLGAASLFAIGLLIAAVAPTAAAGQAAGTLLWFPLMLLAGLWFPRDLMPDGLRTVSDLSPAGAAVHALQDAWFGAAVPTASLLVMAVSALVASALASRLFRWG